VEKRGEMSNGPQDQVPPHDKDAEAAVLATVFIDPPRLADVTPILSPKHFWLNANRKIYEAFVAISEQGKALDILTVRGWLQDQGRLQDVGGPKYLVDILESVPAVANVEAYATRVRNKWRLRNVIAACRRKAAEAYLVSEDGIDAFLESVDEEIVGVTQPETTQDDTMCSLSGAVMQAFKDVKQNVIDQMAGKLSKPRTGFTKLDEMMGGLNQGEFVVIAARPSMGKTSLALQIATHNANMNVVPKIGCLVVSAETTRTKIALSMVAQDARYELSKFQRLAVELEDWAKLAKTANFLSKLPVIIDDRASPSIAHVRNAIRRAQSLLLKTDEDGKVIQSLGVVVLDYIQLCDFETKRESSNREQVVAHIARGCQRMAKDFGVVMIGISQLSRAVDSRQDKRPTMSDLRESGEIEAAAEKIVALYRADYYDKGKKKGKDDHSKGIAEALVLKSKGTATGTVKLKFTGECVRFDNLEVTDDEWGEGDDDE
jgi:replicative DNA helicase